CLSRMTESCGGPGDRERPLAPAALADRSSREHTVELAPCEHALFRQDRFDRVKPPLVIGGTFVIVGRHRLDPTPELIDVHQARPTKRADKRIGEQFPVSQFVLAAVDRRFGRLAPAIVDGRLHHYAGTGTAPTCCSSPRASHTVHSSAIL